MLQYLIPLRAMCSEVHNFESNKLQSCFTLVEMALLQLELLHLT